MRAITRMSIGVAVAAALMLSQRADADLMLLVVRAPQDCPEGLTIRSKAGSSGMIDYDVSLDAERIAHAGELYKGRVRARALLRIGTPGQPVASVTVHGATEGERTRYQFSLSPSAARDSELQLGVSLFEKDGFATVGGGVSMQVHLAGFAPAGDRGSRSKQGARAF
jgi:hypothetical protein